MPIYLATNADAFKDADMIAPTPFIGGRNSIALPSDNSALITGIDTTLVSVPAPKNLEYKYKDAAYYSSLYRLASYYFYNCSMLSTTIVRIKIEVLRKGFEWVPRFQSKCPRCNTAFPRSITKCTVCGFEGKFFKPDVTQQNLFINWEGGSMLDKCNKSGWDLNTLCGSFLTLSLVYNQPLMLCKSIYISDKNGLVSGEIPQEIIPISPACAKFLCDESGEPGDGTGFSIFDRDTPVDMNNPIVKKTSYDPQSHRKIYPARWCISQDITANGSGTYYSDHEIFHKTYGLESINYGLPLSMLVATEIKAWIAASLRIEKSFSTGHPQGVFVISGITTNAFATVKRSVELQMKSDPYSLPMIGVPPAQDRANVVKWIPFSDNPTEQIVKVMSALQERISSIYGVSGLFLGDKDSMKGNSNEQHQMTVMNRTLASLRTFVNSFLRWILSKYPGITDWELRLVEPPDDQSKDEEEEKNKRYQNAILLQQMGFEVISQADGTIEMSSTPKSYDPIKALTDNIVEESDDDGTSGDEVYRTRTASDIMDKPTPSKTFAPTDEVEDVIKGIDNSLITSSCKKECRA